MHWMAQGLMNLLGYNEMKKIDSMCNSRKYHPPSPRLEILV